MRRQLVVLLSACVVAAATCFAGACTSFGAAEPVAPEASTGSDAGADAERADAASDAPIEASTLTLGEVAVLPGDDSQNGGLLIGQQASLAGAATIRSLSFYVTRADGRLRLGIYDGTGPDGGPGALMAETNEMVATLGWNTAEVMAPALLPAGTYWLTYLPESNNLHFAVAGGGQGTYAFFKQPFGPMPPTFSAAPTMGADHWSFYATLTR